MRLLRPGRALLAALLFLARAACWATPPAFHAELAAHWAPIVRQDTAHPTADFVTRFDFDGNWNGADNWENLGRTGTLAAHVYRSVVETQTHYFICYALFHPRDYSLLNNPLTSHENDMEGVQLVIEKDGTRHGRMVLMETLAHWDIFHYSNEKDLARGTDRVDGPIPLQQGRPVVQVEAKGHGIRAWDGKEFPGGDGVVYYPAERAGVPRSRNDRACPYALLDIEDSLWARRFDVGPTKTFGKTAQFPSGTFGSAFAGDTYGKNKANPPWAWDDHNDGDVAMGEWFMNPARAVTVHFRVPRAVSVDYLYNPYLHGDEQVVRQRQEAFARLYGD